MMLPVYVPDWQIGDGDIARPVLGMAFEHVLIFRTDTGNPAMRCNQFGQEATVSGVAEPLAGHPGQAAGAFPTMIRGQGFTLYWDAPALTEGAVTLTGIIDATDYGTVPEGFPSVAGVVASMELSSVLYANTDGGGVNWEPAPGQPQEFRPVGEYPGYVPGINTAVNPQKQVTGVVLHVDTSPGAVAAVAAETAAASAAGGKAATGAGSGLDTDSRVPVRIFPDYAGTVLWLHEPVDYSDAALSPDLAADMAAWEESYYASLDQELNWKSPLSAAQFTATGNGLAQRLADELGGGFEVAFHSYAPGSSRQLFRSDKYGTNQAAASALRAMATAEEQERARLAALSAEAGTGWFAYAPNSGTIFDPNNILPPGFTLPPDFDPERE